MIDLELEPHRTLIASVVEEAKQDDEVIGVLLTGSLARGDALPGTDLDLVLLLAEGHTRAFHREVNGEILVERTYVDLRSAQVQLDTHPMGVYGYLDGRILYDPQKALEGLRRHARGRVEAYRTPESQRAETAFLLRCSRDKMRVALGGGDLLKAAYVAGTSSWQIMEGLWAANDLPVPPNSSVRPHLRDLSKGPPEVERSYRDLFLGDAPRRVEVALDLIDWILVQLGGSQW